MSKAGVANRVEVRVFANKPGNKVVFTHDWSANGGDPQDPPIDLPPKSGHWDLEIQLHDFTGLGLEFESKTNHGADDMWVHKGKGCPKGKGNGGGHVTFNSVTSDRLGVSDNTNGNGQPCDLHFMLCFKDAQGKKHPYDPIIRNGGTTGP
jgi:hypothetical protein